LLTVRCATGIAARFAGATGTCRARGLAIRVDFGGTRRFDGFCRATRRAFLRREKLALRITRQEHVPAVFEAFHRPKVDIDVHIRRDLDVDVDVDLQSQLFATRSNVTRVDERSIAEDGAAGGLALAFANLDLLFFADGVRLVLAVYLALRVGLR
jgi:hypothetical protein